MRTLARRPADAARQIKSLIGDSTAKVEAGGALVHSAGQEMDVVVTRVRLVGDLVGEISAAASAQSHGVAQVGRAVVVLDQTT